MGAATKIQGITVEIGGDTTELGKALGKSIGQSRDLQTELQGVNKMLKMDPSNITLVTQKQELLQEAISKATQKLKMLESAQADVEAKFKDGSISAEQYRDVQREMEYARINIKKYEQELADMDRTQNEAADSADDLGDATEEAGDKAERAGDGFIVLKGTLANLAASGISALIDAMKNLSENSAEIMEQQAKLNTSYEQAGFSGDTAAKAYGELYGVLGDGDQATEASQLLAQLADNTKQVGDWTQIATGVVGTFGDSLPIESLIEASNETAKVGQVTGTLADALNWVGVSEDEFNAKLAACADQTERTALITDTLNGLYADAADAYATNNAALIQSRQNQAALNSSIAGLTGSIDVAKSSLLADFMPSITTVIDGLAAITSGDESGLGKVRQGVQDFSQQLRDQTPEMAETASGMLMLFVSTVLENLPTLIDTGIQTAFKFISSFFSPDNVRATASQAVDMMFALIDTLSETLAHSDIIAALWNIGIAIVDGIWSSIKKRLDSFSQSVREEYGLDGLSPSGTKPNGRHASGLAYVPFDGYIAELHRGERVLTAAEAEAYNALSAARGYDAPISTTSAAPYDRIISSIEQLGADIQNMKLYLNSDKVVGGIQGPLDRAFGMQQMLNERGKL